MSIDALATRPVGRRQRLFTRRLRRHQGPAALGATFSFRIRTAGRVTTKSLTVDVGVETEHYELS